jgi:hypothetical protein
MSNPEWISLFFNEAGSRLARYWGISPSDAEDIIRRVLHRRKILVRSDGPDIYFPRIVTPELPATLLKEVFFSPEFPEAQVIWDELLAACHEEVTSSENIELHIQHPPKLKESERADTLTALDLKARSDEARSAARETPTREAAIRGKTTKREAVAIFIKEKYSGGLPGGITYQEIARDFERSHKVRVHPRTVSRALGHK